MKKITEVWFKEPKLKNNEILLLSYPANHTQKNWRAVGGKLFITTQRVIFLANVMDRNLGGKDFDFELKQITKLFVKRKKNSLKETFSGGLVNRLGIQVLDANEHFFVLSRVKNVLAEIEIIKNKYTNIN